MIKIKIETSTYWNFVAESGNGFQNYLNALKESSFYKPAIILLIPLIGIFTNRKIGWILIQSYSYFLITNLVFKVDNINFDDTSIILTNIALFLLLLLIIIFMNTRKIRNVVYGMEKEEMISKNIIASAIGMTITIILILT
ncbi:hypothetical protein [Winogradskyella sp. SYSU M77433]|uniref:hypothetical protein n=1 Tax=Winogradskyella sp. SYSU M77433 TaxID=3042722 RepID=UPI002480DFC7|nr:hypothetical protein [Winogradskyella sp. SYSU M77433]MDH7914081.1 hypothetical protein [Winogradskyella sp. SYSU M77433]